MKTFLFCLLLIAISLSGCSKSNPTNPNVNTGYGYLTAKIDETSWESKIRFGFDTLPYAVYQESPKMLIICGKSFNINGNDTSIVTVTITIPNNIIGAYALDNTSLNGITVTYEDPKAVPAVTAYSSRAVSGIAGTIKITKVDLVNKIVSGTFNCTVQSLMVTSDQKILKDGAFDVKITQEL
jgi:hypothetical protein